MTSVEELELDKRRHQILGDVKKLVEKYRAIFDWDVSEIDQRAADRLIVAEMHKALDKVEANLLG